MYYEKRFNRLNLKNIFLILLIGAIIGFGVIYHVNLTIMIIGIFLFGTLALIVPITVLLNLLFFTACIDISPVIVFGTYLRPWQVLAIFIIIRCLPLLPHLKITKLILFVLLMPVIFIPSIIYVEDSSGFLVLTFGQLLLSLSIVFIAMNLDKNGIDKYYMVFLNGIYFIIIFGLIQWAGYHIPSGRVIFGEPKATFDSYIRPKSFLNEPDWYGLVCLIGFFMTLGKMIKNKRIYFKNKHTIWAIVCLASLILSAVRASLLGVAVGVVLLLFVKLKFTNKIKVISVGVILLITTMFILQIIGHESLLARFNPNTTYDTNVAAITSRQGSLNLANDLFQKHKIIGNGAGTLGYESALKTNWILYNHGNELSIGRGNVNLIMTTLADSGIFGLVILIIFLFYLFIVKDTGDFQYLATLKIALFASLVSFQFSNGFREGFVWIMMIFIVAIDVYNKKHNNKPLKSNTKHKFKRVYE